MADHAPLHEAALRGPVLPLYVYEPEQLHHEEFAGHHLTYLNDCLRELGQDLAHLGAPLVIQHGEVTEVLERLGQEVDISGLWAHEETGNWVSFQRDLRVHRWARARGIPFTELPQNGVVRRMVNRDGWADTWEERLSAPIIPIPTALKGVSVPSVGLLEYAELGVPPNDKNIPAGGRSVALATLDSFLTLRGVNYMREMSSPLTAEESCSRLSAPLAYGTVSLREVLQATRRQIAACHADPQADPRWVHSLRSYESRLHWHCHFIQRLESEPEMEFSNLNRAMDGLREPHWNPEFFDRWKTGQTGYPLVDACMRMLLSTGWLNFRMRAMLVSFASQHLWLHWRETGLHLARQWLDNEPGIHWSQMQMQSSTVGINRVRIYGPTRQAREQDPTGEFIRRWVPELQGVPSDFIHAPWEWSGASRLSYPPPIVEEGKAGRLARDRIYAVRETPEFEAECRRIYRIHGSRKKAVMRAERVARGLPPKPPKRIPTKPQPMADQPDLFGQTRAIVPSGLPDDWKEALLPEFSAPYFHDLTAFLRAERRKHTIYPPAPDVFNALRLTPLSEVKVLILGQDPYHGPGQAHGLSFSVPEGKPVPPSLQNIFKELEADLGVPPAPSGDLTRWAQQGVLLLNSVMTVRRGQPGSHAGRGWEQFTDAVIRAANAKEGRVVFVLWGGYARRKARLVTGQQHTIIQSAHPSPLSAQKFLGSRPFGQVNVALEEAGATPVEW